MALYRLRDSGVGWLNIGTDDEPREVKLDPKVTYNTDDPQDRELIEARPGLFREVVPVEQATASPGQKRGAAKS